VREGGREGRMRSVRQRFKRHVEQVGREGGREGVRTLRQSPTGPTSYTMS